MFPWLVAGLLLVSATKSLRGQGPGDVVAPGPEADAPAAPAPDDGARATVRFNAAEAPFDAMLDFLARQTGLPVIRQTEVPKGTMSFLSEKDYSIDEAIGIFNLCLDPHSARLVREADFLYLRSLAEAARRPTPVAGAEGLDALGDAEYVTVTVPVRNALASALATQLAPLVKEPGVLRSIDNQNLLVVVETGAQVRRLLALVERIDSVEPANVGFKVHRARFAEPNKLAETLRGLVPEYPRLVALDKDNRPQVYDDVTKPPLRISADERLGAVVVVGPADRMASVESLIDMLDTPASGGQAGAAADGGVERAARVIPATRLSPQDLAAQLDAVFAGLPARERPVIRALPTLGGVAVAGVPLMVAQAEEIARQLDPAPGDALGSAPGGAAGLAASGAEIIDLTHVDVGSVLGTVSAALPPGVAQAVRLSPAPGGQGLMVVAAPEHREMVREIVGELDVPSERDRTVRVVPVRRGRAGALIDTALGLYTAEQRPEWGEVRPRVTPDGRGVVLAGRAAGVEAFARALAQAAAMDRPERTTRVIEVTRSTPERVAGAVSAALAGMDLPEGGPVSVTPGPGVLVLTGAATDLDQAAALVAQLDRDAQAQDAVRVRTIVLRHARAEAIAPVVQRLLTQQSVLDLVPDWARWQVVRDLGPQGTAAQMGRVRVEADARLNALVIAAPDEIAELAEEVVAGLDREPQGGAIDADAAGGDAAARAIGAGGTSIEVVALLHADAARVAETVSAMFDDPRAGEAAPVVRVDEQGNTLVVRGTPAQQAAVAALSRRLDAAAAGGAQTVRAIRIDPSRVSAGEMARTVGRLLEERSGVRVEVISAEELLNGEGGAESEEEAEEVPGGALGRDEPEDGAEAAADNEQDDQPGVRLAVDPQTNTLIVVGPPKIAERVERLIRELEAQFPAEASAIRLIEMPAGVDPQGLAQMIQQAAARAGRVSAENPGGFTGAVSAAADRGSATLIVWANDTDFASLRPLIAGLARTASGEHPIRSVKVERADAVAVAGTLFRFLRDRARLTPGAAEFPEAAVVGDARSGTVLIAASDEQFEVLKSLVEQMDAPGKRQQYRLRIVPLTHVRASDIAETVQSIVGQLQWERSGWFRGQDAGASDEDRVFVETNERTNSVVVFGQGELFDTIERVIAELDRPESDAGKTVAVAVRAEGIDLDAARGLIESVTASPGWRPWWGRDAEAVSVQADRARGVLLLVGKPDRVAEAKGIIDELVAGGLGEQDVVEVVTLRFARAGEIAGALSAALPEGVRARVTPMARNNAVLITGPREDVAEVAARVGTLDVAPEGVPTARVIAVRTLPAERVAATVNEALQPIARALGEQAGVRGDAATNSVVVTGSEAVQARAAELIGELDGAAAGGGDGPAEAGGVSGRPEGAAGEQTSVLVPVRRARAGALAASMRAMLDAARTDAGAGAAGALAEQVRRLNLVGPDGSAAQLDLRVPVRITADEFSNLVAIASTPSNLPALRGLVESLDQVAIGDEVTVRIVPLRHAGAERVRDVLDEFFRQADRARTVPGTDRSAVAENAAGRAVAGRVALAADTRTNGLIVAGPAESVALAEVLIGDLDRDSGMVGLHVIAVEDGDPSRLAPVVDRLMRERIGAAAGNGGRGGALTAFRVEADTASRSLIVAASEENAGAVRELVRALSTGGRANVGPDAADAGVPDSERTELVPVAGAGRAAEVAQLVRELYVDRENRRRGENAVRVSASERLNALIVSGTAADVEEVRRLTGQLGGADVQQVEEVRRVPLESASAREVVTIVEDVLAGRSISGGRPGAGATRLRVLRDELDALEATVDGSVREQVTLTPDGRTNSVLVKAPPAILDLVVALIQDVDKDTRGNRVIEQFRLVNADAVQMQAMLTELFNLQQRGSSFVLAPVREGESGQSAAGGGPGGPAGGGAVDGAGGAERGAGGAQGVFSAVPDERQELSVTVDRRTNTLLVSGTRDLIEEVRRIVEQLDSVEAAERERFVYQLRNADAVEVQDTLRSYFSGESELLRQTLGPSVSGSLLRELEREVTVVGDANSNKLVISASPRYIETVAAIVEELDAAPPQVMIQVLIAEVTLDASDQWGADLSIGGVVGLPQVGTGGIGGRDGRFNTLAAGTGVTTALGVPNLAVGSDDFSLLIRALQAQGKLEVLSRPQVQVANNQEAFIQVGEDVTVPVGTVQSGDLLRAETERREVGIILRVTPAISSDGFVRMDIAPEISDVSNRTTQIDENFEVPIITQRRVDTTVTVKDGQSVVIGGLIQTSQTERKTKVPLFGDIPVLGGLFRSRQDDEIKTELLVILTPYVVPGESGAAVRRMESLTGRALDSLTDRTGVENALRRGDGPGAGDSWVVPVEGGEQTPGPPAPPQPPAATGVGGDGPVIRPVWSAEGRRPRGDGAGGGGVVVEDLPRGDGGRDGGGGGL
jgi:type II secretion system protein D